MRQIRLTLCVWMDSAGEGSRVGSKELLCPPAGPLPEEEAASGNHYWLPEEPVSIIKTITSLNQALFHTPETFSRFLSLGSTESTGTVMEDISRHTCRSRTDKVDGFLDQTLTYSLDLVLA